jgi:hypothetical protein
MIPKSTIVLSAGVVLGLTSTVLAYQLDANTGLPTELYYGPICQHVQQGLPVREEMRNRAGCKPQASTKATASAFGESTIRQLENRPRVMPASSDDKHKPW